MPELMIIGIILVRELLKVKSTLSLLARHQILRSKSKVYMHHALFIKQQRMDLKIVISL